MGSKNHPGKFNCYVAAEPDEPMFILLGRDPVAPLLVALWAIVRQSMGTASEEKVAEAAFCAAEMDKWAAAKGKDTTAAEAAFRRAIENIANENRKSPEPPSGDALPDDGELG